MLELGISCATSDWQLSSLAQICALSLPRSLLWNALEYTGVHPRDPNGKTTWRTDNGRSFFPVYYCDDPGHIGDFRRTRRTSPASPRSKGERDRSVARTGEYLFGRGAITKARLRCYRTVCCCSTALWPTCSYPPPGKRTLLAHAP